MRGRIKGGHELAASGRAGYCKACERHMPDGPDACLGYLAGVSHACCGHGTADAYVVIGGQPDQPIFDIPDAVKLKGYAALEFFVRPVA